jgi:peptidoglycan hydrolase FlgJ
MGISTTPTDSLGQMLAADPQSMSGIEAKISHDPKGAIHDVSQQFEAMFLENLLKTMRETHYSDDDQSSEMQTWRGMLDQQLVQSMTSGSGIGLAKVLEQQISRMAHLDDGTSSADAISGGTPVVGSVPVLQARALRAYQAALSQVRAQNQAVTAQNKTAAAPSASTDDNVSVGGARGFVRSMLPQATAAAQQLGVAPEVVVAHAALESGWGRRAIRNADGSDSHNLFGIKAGSDWNGATTNIVTTEYVNGAPQKKVDTFRSYGSYQDAFTDYANMLGTSSRYRNVLNQGRNIQGFAHGLQSGGYATDPRYARKLVDVMSAMAQYMAQQA